MIEDAWYLLQSMDLLTLMSIFWFTCIFDIPRYLLGMIVIVIAGREKLSPLNISTSAVIAGYNESGSLRACVESVKADQIVIVDDGSTDGMWEVAKTLLDEGKADVAIRLPFRSSKIAAVNIGCAATTNEIILIVDADTELKPDCVSQMIRYFADPEVGAVSANLIVRNEDASLTTKFQAIEYAMGITMGRRVTDMLGIMPNVSGACGAFRRVALEEVDWLDMEVAEDSAVTMKLRQAGWKIRFAPTATAMTNAPETVTALTLQRMRWDKAIITLWWRKHRHNLNPFRKNFTLTEAWVNADIIIFGVILPCIMPLYIVSLVEQFGEFSLVLMSAVFMGLCFLDLLAFVMSGSPLRLLVYLPLYTLMQIVVLRPIHLAALFLELAFHSSHRDNYIPEFQRYKLT